MKKGNLLASTALVSALAMAGSAQALDLSLGGYAEFWTGYADNKDEADLVNEFDVKQDAEIYFLAEEKLDNGLTVGFRLEMEAGPGNPLGSGPNDDLGANASDPPEQDDPDDTTFDEMFAYVKTNFGQVNIGNNDVATGYVPPPRTVGPVGVFKSDANDWIPNSFAAGNPTMDADLGMGDAQNITYFTPRVAGFQAIVSYTPDGSDTAEGDFDESETEGVHDGVSGALRFNRKFGEVGVGLSGGYTTVSRTNNGGESLHGYVFNADLTFGPARVTAAYGFEELVSREDEYMGASILYSLDQMNTVSLAYAHGERKEGADLESDIITAGWSRNMGKGVSIAASLFWAETEDGNNPDADRDGVGVVGGLRLAF